MVQFKIRRIPQLFNDYWFIFRVDMVTLSQLPLWLPVTGQREFLKVFGIPAFLQVTISNLQFKRFAWDLLNR